MGNNNWTLIVFTLLMQFSAGVVLIYNLFLVLPANRKNERIPFRFQMILLVAAVAALAGIAFSLLHLGNPQNALKTLSNLNESWLSREILFVLIYSGLLFLVTALQFIYPRATRSYKWILDLTSLSGLVLVYVMSRIYTIPAMPAWNSIFTPLSFYLAMLLSGSSILLLFQLNSGSWASQKGLAVLIIAIPVIQIGLLPLHMSWLEGAGAAGHHSLSLLLDQYLPGFYLRLGLEILTIAFGFWAFFSIRSDTTRNRNLIIPAVLAFITMAAALSIDRFLFYAQNLTSAGL
jgi:anaerobic dimethyl sulfoxide reductase subunit C (anchor subunit)